MSRFCPNCGSELKEGSAFCSSCGAKTAATGNSAAVNPAGNNQAPIIVNIQNTNTNTNANVTDVSEVTPLRAKNKWVALILCLFLGLFGAHRFYEGKTGTAILWLCTCGLCGIGAIIDFVILLFKPNPYYV